MQNKALTILLLLGIALLMALSIANLIVSKRGREQVDKLVTEKVASIVQSPDFLDTIGNYVPQQAAESVKGDKGDSIVGPQGLQGKNGKDGKAVNGKDGKDGKDGKNGQSAYEVWLAQGNTGTQQDFINSITGPKGDQGPPGEVLQLQWKAGTLQSKYSGDDFWVTVPSLP